MKKLIVILALAVAFVTAASASATPTLYWWSLSQARAYYHNIALVYHGSPIVFTVAPTCVGVGKGHLQKWPQFTCHGPATSTSKTDPMAAPVTKQYRWTLTIWPGKNVGRNPFGEGVTSNIQVIG